MSMRISAAIAVVLIGCGGKTTQVDGATTGTGGSLTGGDGGGATTSGVGGSGSGQCDPSLANACDEGEYCNAPSGACGMGKCKIAPDGCLTDCPGACGCDGKTYCNACLAQMAGVDASDDVGCLAHRIQQRALYWPGGLDHLILMHADLTSGVCLRLYADAPTDFGLAVTTISPWTVSNIEASNALEGCLDDQAPLIDSVVAVNATGSLIWETGPSGFAPCTLDAHVSIQWDAPPSWLLGSTTIAAVNLSVDQGCF